MKYFIHEATDHWLAISEAVKNRRGEWVQFHMEPGEVFDLNYLRTETKGRDSIDDRNTITHFMEQLIGREGEVIWYIVGILRRRLWDITEAKEKLAAIELKEKMTPKPNGYGTEWLQDKSVAGEDWSSDGWVPAGHVDACEGWEKPKKGEWGYKPTGKCGRKKKAAKRKLANKLDPSFELKVESKTTGIRSWNDVVKGDVEQYMPVKQAGKIAVQTNCANCAVQTKNQKLDINQSWTLVKRQIKNSRRKVSTSDKQNCTSNIHLKSKLWTKSTLFETSKIMKSGKMTLAELNFDTKTTTSKKRPKTELAKTNTRETKMSAEFAKSSPNKQQNQKYQVVENGCRLNTQRPLLNKKRQESGTMNQRLTSFLYPHHFTNQLFSLADFIVHKASTKHSIQFSSKHKISNVCQRFATLSLRGGAETNNQSNNSSSTSITTSLNEDNTTNQFQHSFLCELFITQRDNNAIDKHQLMTVMIDKYGPKLRRTYHKWISNFEQNDFSYRSRGRKAKQNSESSMDVDAQSDVSSVSTQNTGRRSWRQNRSQTALQYRWETNKAQQINPRTSTPIPNITHGESIDEIADISTISRGDSSFAVHQSTEHLTSDNDSSVIMTTPSYTQMCSSTISSSSTKRGSKTSRQSKQRRNPATGRFEKVAPVFQYDEEDGLSIDPLANVTSEIRRQIDPQTEEDEDGSDLFQIPALPKRIRRPPPRFDQSFPKSWTDNPITHNCRNNAHKDVFCASETAGHTPRYYNSLKPYGDKKKYNCPYCKAVLLQSEATGHAAYSKCCAKGKVKLARMFYNLQKPFLGIKQRTRTDEDAHNQLDAQTKMLDSKLNELVSGKHFASDIFLNKVDVYNREMAFGTATAPRDPAPIPGGYQPVKMNGMVTYRISGINPPEHQDGTTSDELCGQVWTLTPNDAIALRQQRNIQQNLRLDNALLTFLHNLLGHNIIGHELAKTYYHLKRIYDDEKRKADEEGRSMVNFRIRLLSRAEVLQRRHFVNPNIHPHRTLLPEDIRHLAQIYFVEADEGLPPIEEDGVVLKGIAGEVKKVGWWELIIDGALCPLLFPRNNFLWKPKMDLGIPTDPDEFHQNYEDAQQRDPSPNSTIADDDFPLWDDNPYGQEAEDPLLEEENDDNGEGEQLMLENEPTLTHHVSRSQAARYMMQIRPPLRNAGNVRQNSWYHLHWLWWGRRLAEYYSCLLINRIERDKYANIKKRQIDKRSIRSKELLDFLERQVQAQLDPQGRPLGARGKLGRVFMPPSSLRGSRQYYQRNYTDVQTICREYGAPHLLITFTMNSDAPEFKTMLAPGQTIFNRPDIADRVFIDKSKEFLKDIVQRQVLGPVKAWFYSVEHQKRGLPHLHLVVILDWEKLKKKYPRDVDYIDDYICAEIPELPANDDHTRAAGLQRRYRKLVLESMYHTCKPSYCLQDGKCTKHFPRPFSEQTIIDDQVVGVKYRRRTPPLCEEERAKEPWRFGLEVDGKNNQYVVPHNRYLLLKYQSHINIEWVQSDACVKYVLKYVMKGCDLAFVQVVHDTPANGNHIVVDYDEFRQIRMARYQTPNEAILSIWGNRLVRKSHVVSHQRVHLPGEYRIVFDDGEELEQAEREQERIDAGLEQKTALTAYFTLNREKEAEVKEYTFLTIQKNYFYAKKDNIWIRRQKEIRNHLVSIDPATPRNLEEQALRLLLLHVKAPTGWKALQTFNNIEYQSFAAAAKARGLLEDSTIWVLTILEAIGGLPSLRRRISWTAVLFANAGIMDASDVLERVIADQRSLLTPRSMRNRSLEDIKIYILFRMEIVFRLNGVDQGIFDSCCARLGLGNVEGFVMSDDDRILAEYNAGDYAERMWGAHMGSNDDDEDDIDGPLTTGGYALKNAEYYPKLYDVQKEFVDAVSASLNQLRAGRLTAEHQMKMLKGDGGTGKTFTYNALIARLRALYKCRIMATASTGIAADLLFEGATMHSKLRIPLDIEPDTIPLIEYQSNTGKILRQLEVLIIDEISAANKLIIMYIDRLLRSLAEESSDVPFGGKIILFGGDWKQLLPVIDNTLSTEDALTAAFCASVKNTEWFKEGRVKSYHLRVNKRLNVDQEEYRQRLKCWGTGITAESSGKDDNAQIIYKEQLESFMCLHEEKALINFVFGDSIKDPWTNINLIKGCAILCPLNKDCFRLNNQLMERIKITSTNPAYMTENTYLSIDKVDPDNPSDILALHVSDSTIENIYKKTPPGLPEHKLHLHIGAVMMIIVNLNVPQGLCNGTRVQIMKLGEHIVWCRYIQGPRNGKEIMLHRHRFHYGGRKSQVNKYGVVKWSRLQFPLRPGFVMTTHKSQGQTLAKVGLHLETSACFAHGQYYVSTSRVEKVQDIRVLTKRGSGNRVRNLVVQDIIDKEDIEEAKKYAKTLPVIHPPRILPSSPGVEIPIDDSDDGDDDDNDDDDSLPPHRPRQTQQPTLGQRRNIPPALSVNVQQTAQTTPFPNNLTVQHLDKINIVQEDITKVNVDIIVNAANSAMCGGGGVDGAIHHACAPQEQLLRDELKRQKNMLYGNNEVPDGGIIVTPTYGKLRQQTKAQYIIHAVGPQYSNNRSNAQQLADQIALKNCYKNALDELVRRNMRTIAFPAISTGIYAFPDKIAVIAVVQALTEWLLSDPNHLNSIDAINLCFRDQTKSQFYSNYFTKVRDLILRMRGTAQPSTNQVPASSFAPLQPTRQPSQSTIERVFDRTNGLFPVENVRGDGDCFFRAVVRSLTGFEEGENVMTLDEACTEEHLQTALRRATARAMMRRYYNANVDDRDAMQNAVIPPVDPTGDGAGNNADRALRRMQQAQGINTFEGYANRMMRPANYEEVAWANANFEGEYVANILNRPVSVLTEWTDQFEQTRRNLIVYFPGHRRMNIEYADFATLTANRFARVENNDDPTFFNAIPCPNGDVEIVNPVMIFVRGNHFWTIHGQMRNPATAIGIERFHNTPFQQWTVQEERDLLHQNQQYDSFVLPDCSVPEHNSPEQTHEHTNEERPTTPVSPTSELSHRMGILWNQRSQEMEDQRNRREELHKEKRKSRLGSESTQHRQRRMQSPQTSEDEHRDFLGKFGRRVKGFFKSGVRSRTPPKYRPKTRQQSLNTAPIVSPSTPTSTRTFSAGNAYNSPSQRSEPAMMQQYRDKQQQKEKRKAQMMEEGQRRIQAAEEARQLYETMQQERQEQGRQWDEASRQHRILQEQQYIAQITPSSHSQNQTTSLSEFLQTRREVAATSHWTQPTEDRQRMSTPHNIPGHNYPSQQRSAQRTSTSRHIQGHASPEQQRPVHIPPPTKQRKQRDHPPQNQSMSPEKYELQHVHQRSHNKKVAPEPEPIDGFTDHQLSRIHSEISVFYDIQECTICKERIEQGQLIVILNCRHVFHKDCIIRALRYGKKCPNCRTMVIL